MQNNHIDYWRGGERSRTRRVVRPGRCGRPSARLETGVRRRRSIDYSPTTAWVGGTEPNAAGSDGGRCRRPSTRVRRPPDPRQSDGRGTERRVRTRIRRPTGRLRTLGSHYLSNFVIVSVDIIPSPVTTAMVTRVDCRGSCVPDDVVGPVGAGALDVRTLIPFRRCWRRPARLRGRSPSLRSVESAGAAHRFGPTTRMIETGYDTFNLTRVVRRRGVVGPLSTRRPIGPSARVRRTYRPKKGDVGTTGTDRNGAWPLRRSSRTSGH
jgi:hypothetical protein